jgi:hypothetical protein
LWPSFNRFDCLYAYYRDKVVGKIFIGPTLVRHFKEVCKFLTDSGIRSNSFIWVLKNKHLTILKAAVQCDSFMLIESG